MNLVKSSTITKPKNARSGQGKGGERPRIYKYPEGYVVSNFTWIK